jgi:hypothetical protein
MHQSPNSIIPRHPQENFPPAAINSDSRQRSRITKGNDLTLRRSSRRFRHLMSQRTLRTAGAIGMLLLLTAQTMGWCRAYVCECSGVPEFTASSHCHDSEHIEGEDHEDHLCHFGDCEEDHEHDLITVSYSAPLPHVDPTLSPKAWVESDLLPISPFRILSLAQLFRRQVEHDPGPPLRARHRHTLAMLI